MAHLAPDYDNECVRTDPFYFVKTNFVFEDGL